MRVRTQLWPIAPVRATRSEAVRFIAERQHGLIANRQAVAVGMSLDMIDRCRRQGRWLRVAPTVSALGCRPSTFEAELVAALLWAGPDAAAAGASAARLCGIDRATDRIEIVVAHGRALRRRPGVVIRRTRHLDPQDDLTRTVGFPATTINRTLLDGCATRSRDDATDLVDEAIRLGRATPASVLAYASRLSPAGRPQVTLLVELARALDTRTDSAFERRALDLIRAFGLPEPLRQAAFTWAGRSGRVDFAWPEARLVLECDGFAFHRRRRDLDRDRWRRRALAALAQDVVSITWDDVRDRAAFAPVAADLAARIARAEGRLGAVRRA